MAESFDQALTEYRTMKSDLDDAEAVLTKADATVSDLRPKVAEKQKELLKLSGVSANAEAEVPAAKRGPGRPAGKNGKAKGKGPKRGLGKIILDMLMKKGMEVKEIAVAVQKMVDAGTYESSAENLLSNVSQAIHKLKKQKLIKKDEETKKYAATEAAA